MFTSTGAMFHHTPAFHRQWLVDQWYQPIPCQCSLRVNNDGWNHGAFKCTFLRLYYKYYYYSYERTERVKYFCVVKRWIYYSWIHITVLKVPLCLYDCEVACGVQPCQLWTAVGVSESCVVRRNMSVLSSQGKKWKWIY